MMQLLTPSHWRDYELIDSGGSEKIERFGKFILIRPEPQALWDRSMSREEWQGMSHAEFRKEKNDPEKGKWILKKGTPEQWEIGYANGEMKLRMRLGLTAFRHIGVFPEQAENWDFIFNTIGSFPKTSPRVLNLFAYTGGASLAARAAGADVLHLDSVKPVVTWARENMELSRLDGIRWIVEDALKFVQREVRRGSKYSGIILDPPAYGRGPEGEKWVIDDGLPEMIKCCGQLLEPENSFLILNMYSIGFSALVADNLINSCFSKTGKKEYGELYLSDKFSKRLPLGTFLRFVR